VAQDGTILLEQHKMLLPTYDVFDELRYFEPATSVRAVTLHGRRVGVSICEDFWFDDEIFDTKMYCTNPVDELARQAWKCCSTSARRHSTRASASALRHLLAHRGALPHADRLREPSRGNDELLFDGSSIVIDAAGGRSTAPSRSRRTRRWSGCTARLATPSSPSATPRRSAAR